MDKQNASKSCVSPFFADDRMRRCCYFVPYCSSVSIAGPRLSVLHQGRLLHERYRRLQFRYLPAMSCNRFWPPRLLRRQSVLSLSGRRPCIPRHASEFPAIIQAPVTFTRRARLAPSAVEVMLCFRQMGNASQRGVARMAGAGPYTYSIEPRCKSASICNFDPPPKRAR